MASRAERRKRAALRRSQEPTHGEAMLERAGVSQVAKAEASRQLSDDRDTQFHDLYASDRAIRPPYDLETLVLLYEHHALHSGCIDAKVSDTVGRGWLLEPDGANEDAADDEDARKAAEAGLRDWLRERCQRPTGAGPMPFQQLTAQLAREQEQTGWGMWEIVREQAAPGSPIAAILPLPAHTIRAVKGDPNLFVQVRDEKKVYFKRFGDERTIDAATGHELESDVPATEVLIFDLYSARSSWYGIPRWMSCVPALAELTAIREFNVSWFESGGKADRVVHVTDDDAAVAKKVADEITAQMLKVRTKPGHSTVVSYGKTGAKVEVHELAGKTGKGGKDGDFKVSKTDLQHEVLIGHQVPPYRVGLAELGSLGGSAAKEMLDAYRYGTIEPPQETLEELLQATIFNPEQGGYDLAGWLFRFKDVDWEELERDVSAAAEAVENAVASPNEGRAMIGLSAHPDPVADQLHRQGQPLTGLAEQAAETALAETTKVLREFRGALEAVVKDDEREPIAEAS